MSQYKCSKCGIAVIVIPNEEPIKPCKCDAPITAEASATTQGSGGVKI